jgi:MYXO-CTERM domain-containing protein
MARFLHGFGRMGLHPKHFFAAAGVTLAFAAMGEARASCIHPAGCICPSSSPSAVFSGTVLSVSDKAIVRLDRVVPNPGSGTNLQVGDEITVDRALTPPIFSKGNALQLSEGDRVIGYGSIFQNDPETVGVVNEIAADDTVTCSSLRLSVTEAESEMLRSDCREHVVTRGLEIPPCNDILEAEDDGGCSVTSAPVPGASSGVFGWIVALGLLLRRARPTSAREVG